MHENNFEKQVQEKMDQLGFDPSDAVWAAVDKEINKEKRRRRPFFVLFFLSGLLLAGGGVYFGMIKSPVPKIVAGQQQKGKKENPVEQSESKVRNSNHQETSLNGKIIPANSKNTELNSKGEQSRASKLIKSGNDKKWLSVTENYNAAKTIKKGNNDIEDKEPGNY